MENSRYHFMFINSFPFYDKQFMDAINALDAGQKITFHGYDKLDEYSTVFVLAVNVEGKNNYQIMRAVLHATANLAFVLDNIIIKNEKK